MPALSPLPFSSRRAAFLFFVAAALPRLWSLDWASPLKKAHIDEAVVIFYALRAATLGADPAIFHDYPGFFIYGLAALMKAVLWGAGILGRIPQSPAEVFALYTQGDRFYSFVLIARLVNVVLGALIAVVLARWGGRRWGAFAGGAAALFWALSPLPVLHAHYGTVDMLTTFLVLLAVCRIGDYWETAESSDGRWSAFFIGLAAAAKYYPAVLLPFLLPAPFVRKTPGAVRTCFSLAGLSFLGFAAGSPLTLMDPASFVGRFFHLFPKILGQPGGEVSALLWPTLSGIFSGAGGLVILTAMAGMVFFWRGEPRRAGRVVAAVSVFLIGFWGLWRIQSPHYALPVYPLLFLAAGRALSALGRYQKVLPWAGLFLLCGTTLPGTARTLSMLSRRDTRLEALSWARAYFPPGSRLLRFSHTPEFSALDPFQVKVDYENRLLSAGAPLDGFDGVLYAAYSSQGDVHVERLSRAFSGVKVFGSTAPARGKDPFPHHPTVFVFYKKDVHHAS